MPQTESPLEALQIGVNQEWQRLRVKHLLFLDYKNLRTLVFRGKVLLMGGLKNKVLGISEFSEEEGEMSLIYCKEYKGAHWLGSALVFRGDLYSLGGQKFGKVRKLRAEVFNGEEWETLVLRN